MTQHDMRGFARTMIVPFCMALFPSIWYINRNVMTERLPPRTEPTTELVAGSITIAIVSSLCFAAVFASLWPRTQTGSDQTVSYYQRIIRPEGTALTVFLCFNISIFIWAAVELGGVGPSWVGDVLSAVLSPLGFPLLILAPLTIRFHWAVIIALIFCVLWMSLLANVGSDLANSRA